MIHRFHPAISGFLLTAVVLSSSTAFGQSIGALAPGAAGIDLSGIWAPVFHEDQPERIPGPELVNYAGLPINEAARTFALSWDASRLTIPEHPCQVHVAPYIYRGPLNLRIWDERDDQSQRIVAIKQYISTYEQTRTIWMDGRAHPSQYAAHTWMGFSTGKWDGRILTVYTTHIKQGWVRRNGLPESDQATLVEHFIRHGNILTHVSIVTDPVYLSEPLIKSQDFNLILQGQQNWLYPCESVVEIPNQKRDRVPNYLLGRNPFLHEYADNYHLPIEGTLGGAATMYPEFRLNPKNAVAKNAPPPVPPPVRYQQSANGELEILKVQGNVYLLAGAGGNVVVQAGDQGLLVVDTGAASMSDKLLTAIRKLSDKPIQYIVNSSFHPDHTGGNEAVRKAGVTITGANVAGNLTDATVGAQIIAHENVLNRMSAPTGKQAPTAFNAWPTETYISGQKEVFFNEEPVEIQYQPAASTDGDSVVLFRRSDVVATGDVFDMTSYPVVDVEHGGSVQGEIDALDHILDLAIPKHEEEGGTYVVPGRGRICDEFDVLEYRDMVVIVRDRIQAAIQKGMTLEQVKTANLTVDYDGRFGRQPGSGDRFVESVYKSLSAKKQ